MNRRLAHATDVSTTMVYSDRSSSLGAALRNMTRGEVSASPAILVTMRRILTEFSKLSPRSESPTNEKTVQQIHDEIQMNYFNDEVNATTPLLGRSDGFGWACNPDDMVAADTTNGDGTSSSGTVEHVLQTVMDILDMGESEVSNRAILSWLLIRVNRRVLYGSTTGGAQFWEKH